MSARVAFGALVLLICCGVAYGKEERWTSFAEDADLSYYLDRKSVSPLPNGGYLFWIRSVAKDKEYYRREYNLSGLAYILTNYELDCGRQVYRVRQSVMFDRNRKELSKSGSGVDAPFEPIQPETIVEMAQDTFCTKGDRKPQSAPGKKEQGLKGEEPAQSEEAPRLELTPNLPSLEQVPTLGSAPPPAPADEQPAAPVPVPVPVPSSEPTLQ